MLAAAAERDASRPPPPPPPPPPLRPPPPSPDSTTTTTHLRPGALTPSPPPSCRQTRFENRQQMACCGATGRYFQDACASFDRSGLDVEADWEPVFGLRLFREYTRWMMSKFPPEGPNHVCPDGLVGTHDRDCPNRSSGQDAGTQQLHTAAGDSSRGGEALKFFGGVFFSQIR
ncbi:hypothetical protein B0T24DRAFT_366993 [Lasiosphaeria ovina]|uniref:Uncharacterized protein n=1 Tax=Lasiosphaeria ovina TaxID=92902 RepID=A0AAE0JZB7_9PEZI|nr:hypothetical protein B0T24DRAFT_366993 [Lasiosphaeria ovina]